MKKINEAKWAPNINVTDENLSINGIYQQAKLPSLGRCIFTVTDIHGPTAAIFNVATNSSGDVAILRNEVEVYEGKPIKTAITQEAFQDIESQYGLSAFEKVAKLLRGQANDYENEKTIDFLKANAVTSTDINLSEPTLPDISWREVSWKVQQLILEMNSLHIRTYNAFVVLPYKLASSIMSVFADLHNSELAEPNRLFIGKSGLTDWFVNPDPDDDTCYVGLVDANGTGRECAVFSPYTDEVTLAIDPESGEYRYFIWDRFAITISPLHTSTEPMLMSFKVLGI